MSRKSLIRAMLVMLSIAIILVFYVINNSLAPSQKAEANATIKIDISDLVIGETKIFKVAGNIPLILHKPTKKQLQDLTLLDGHVWNNNQNSYNKGENLIVLVAMGSRFGLPLDHYEKKLTKLTDRQSWKGGYSNKSSEVSYDYFGRVINTPLFTLFGFRIKTPDLSAPIYKTSINKITNQKHISLHLSDLQLYH